MKKLSKILFISCLKASELIEKKIELKLNFIEKIQLKMHKMVCEACTRYEKQSLYIDKSFKSLAGKTEINTDLKQLKSQIANKLEQHKN